MLSLFKLLDFMGLIYFSEVQKLPLESLANIYLYRLYLHLASPDHDS